MTRRVKRLLDRVVDPRPLVVRHLMADGSGPAPGFEREAGRRIPKNATVFTLWTFEPGDLARVKPPPQNDVDSEATPATPAQSSAERPPSLGSAPGQGLSAAPSGGEPRPVSSENARQVPPDSLPGAAADMVPAAEAPGSEKHTAPSEPGASPSMPVACDCGARPHESHGLNCWLGDELRRESYRHFAGPNRPPLAEPRNGLQASRLAGIRIGEDGAMSFESESAAPADLDSLRGFGDAQDALRDARAADARERAQAWLAGLRAENAAKVERSVVEHEPSLDPGECLCPTCRRRATEVAPTLSLGKRTRHE